MLQKVLLFVARHSFGKKLVDLLAKPSEFARGKRSELLLGVYALLELLRYLGLLEGDLAGLADALETGLLGALPLTMADKARQAKQVTESLLKK